MQPVVRDQAVSPLVGVLLMLLVTSLLAASIILLVDKEPDDPLGGTSLTFKHVEAGDWLEVVRGAPSAVWSDVRVQLASPCQVSLNGASPVQSSGPIGQSDVPIQGGDRVHVSRSDGSSGSCSITLSYAPENRLLGTWAFDI